jgi:nuclease S1
MTKHLGLFARASLILCLVALTPARAAAWGGEGHRITARVAWAKMRQTTRNKIVAILGNSGSLESAAVWPDTLYSKPAQWGYTYRWHFADIPTDSDHKYLASRDCVKESEGDCVINAIARERATLAGGGNASQRRNALRFLIHFVGDLHQPLHCAEDEKDVGGNLKPVCFFGVCWESSGKNKNLHMTWDKLMIQHTGVSEDDYVADIVERIDGMSQSELRAIRAGDPVAWAEAAHRLAVDNAYAPLPEPKKKFNKKKKKYYNYYLLGQEYHDRNIGHVDGQLLKGGVRLAAILDEALN